MRFLFLFVSALFSFSLSAQTINDNSVVKDSSGAIYPAAVWRMLLMKGDYGLKAEDKTNPQTAFLLVRLSPEEKEARMAKLPPPRECRYFKTGQKFNLGKVRDLKGQKIDLKENNNKITVVNFWFINCAPCRREIPDLNELVARYASDSIRFVAVALDGKSEIEEFLTQLPFNYQIVDDGRFLATRYGIQSYPTHVVVDQEGKVYFHTTGLSPNTVYYLEKSIKELIQKEKAAAVPAP